MRAGTERVRLLVVVDLDPTDPDAGEIANEIKSTLQYDGIAVVEVTLLPSADKEWSGSQCPIDPANCWVDDATGEHVRADTGIRTREHGGGQ